MPIHAALRQCQPVTDTPNGTVPLNGGYFVAIPFGVMSDRTEIIPSLQRNETCVKITLFSSFSRFFRIRLKQYGCQRLNKGMRLKRKLTKNVWYEVRTAVNVGEPLFLLGWSIVLLHRVLREAKKRFAFEMRGLRLDGKWLTFYIKPADGFQLPKIMQWLKQTFSARFNVRTGRTGHVWGDRYRSEILEGEPPEWAKEVDWTAVDVEANKEIPMAITYSLSWDSPRLAGMTEKMRFSFKTVPAPATPSG
jgi:hypothetical protein